MWTPTGETKSGTDRDVPDAARSSSTLDLVEAPPRSRLKPEHPALGLPILAGRLSAGWRVAR